MNQPLDSVYCKQKKRNYGDTKASRCRLHSVPHCSTGHEVRRQSEVRVCSARLTFQKQHYLTERQSTGYSAASIQINKPRGALSRRLHTEHTPISPLPQPLFHQTSNTYLTAGFMHTAFRHCSHWFSYAAKKKTKTGRFYS